MLKTYEKKIKLIEDEIVEIVSRLIKASKISLSGIVDKDMSRFKEAKDSVNGIQNDCERIDTNVTTTLALFSPEAKDLRKLVSYLKITSDLAKTAASIKAYNKNIIKNFEENEHYFTSSDSIETLQKASIAALKCTLEIINEEDKDILLDQFKQITAEVDRTETVYEIVEKELLSLEKITVEAFAQNSAILKTFRKLDKITNRVMDIASALLYAKLDKSAHRE